MFVILNQRVIFQGLRMNRTLLSLSLANNSIGDEGVKQIAQVKNLFVQYLFQMFINHIELYIIKSLCVSQRLLVLQKIQKKFSSYYSSSRHNLVRTSPPTVLMIQICHLAHIFI